MLKSIHHINIVVKDLERTRDFFQLFGFTIIHEKKLKGEWIDKVTDLREVQASYISLGHENSSLTLELLQYNHPEGGIDSQISFPNQIGYRHLALEVDNLEKETQHLKNKGVEFYSEIQTNPYGKKMCYFTGPDGILLELLEL